jgi:flagellin-like hook-associated protein FlgL
MDTDVALNAAELVKDDMREHAASAVLAQANQLPALLLRLLTEE